MPVKVRCTGCDKVLTVPDAARGKAVKCPNCEAKIAVPAADAPAKSSKSADPKKKAATKSAKKSVDSEDALATLDLRRAEDTEARICPKCGYDMQDLDEEETECPKCGFDVEAGGLGVKAKKRALKGPDPADFYPGLAKNAWSFMLKNQQLAWRTDIYTLVCVLICMGCGFMYLWISAWPPRAFFGLCFTVAFLVIPGWLWVLDSEVIKLTLERKDKFKRLNFDFFLASAKGVLFVAWLVAVGVPILLIPAGIGYYLVNYNNQPPWMMGVCLGVGAIPLIWMLPIMMSHMTMPIPAPGWMVWKMLQFWGRTIAGSGVWLMWLLLTCIPLIGGVATIGAVWGRDIESIVLTMESNADINRRLLEAANAPKGKNAPAAVDPATIGTPVAVDFMPLIGPAVILVVMCLPLGFIGLFNMRTNGQFTYYFRDRLELIDKAKEYKYVAGKRKSEEDEDEPKTAQEDFVAALVLTAVCFLVGGVGGTIWGVFSMPDIVSALIWGVFCGFAAIWIVAHLALLGKAFEENPMWGIGIILFSPIVDFIFMIVCFDRIRQVVFLNILAYLSLVLLIVMLVAGAVAIGASAAGP